MDTVKQSTSDAESKPETLGGIFRRVPVVDLIGALKGATALLEKGSNQGVCPGCQALIESAKTYCAACGVLLRFACPRCKSECLRGYEFCASCGLKLTGENIADTITAKARQEEEKQQQAIDLLEPFTEIEKLSEGRCLKLRARRRDTGVLRFLKKATGVESRKFLENEAAVLSAWSHPRLIKLHGAHRHREQMVLELDFLEPAQFRFPLCIDRLCQNMHQVAEGLAALHDRGLLHGDIKPQNILFRDGGAPERDALILCDLEFAQEPGPSRFKAMTPLFAAPEQIVGDHIDFRADVYAFGVMFYLWFFYDRLPSILDVESPSHRAMGAILGTTPHLGGTPLDEFTQIQEISSFRSTPRVTREDGLGSEAEVLGAKYHFCAELERITGVNRRLDLTEDILELVSDATEIERDKRPPDGRALMERMERLLRKLEATPSV